MGQELEVNIDELVQLLKQRGIPLPFEMGAFIALEVCEQIFDAPTRIRAQDVFVGSVGEISVEPVQGSAAPADSVRSVLVLLGDLLVCSAPGVPPMLLELVEQGPSGGEWSLARLRDDLEACLLPLNRGATRRVLARLLREVRKQGERSPARADSSPDAGALDAELDVLLGGAADAVDGANATPARADATRATGLAAPAGSFMSASAASAVEQSPAHAAQDPRDTFETGEFEVDGTGSYDAVGDPGSARSGAFDALDDDEIVEAVREAKLARAQRDSLAAPHVGAAVPETGPTNAGPVPGRSAPVPPGLEPRGLQLDALIEEDAQRRAGGSVGFVVGGLLVLAAVLLAVAYLVLGQAGTRELLGLAALPSAAPAPAPTPVPAPRPNVGTLEVRSEPPRAQVFLLVGKGPVVVPQLPVGIAHEFVALGDGGSVGRGLVPADAVWEESNGELRYELALQTSKRGKSDGSKGEGLDLGQTLLPRALGVATGALGSVRVLTAPPQAKVYQLIGFTPEVRVENLSLDRSYELLVHLPGRAAVTQRVDAADFREQGERRVAALTVRLPR